MSHKSDKLTEDLEMESSCYVPDRSKVRVLLCDSDSESCQNVVTLLSKCTYQVTAVKKPRQLVNALNAQGQDIDIILSEVDLPVAKGFKLLKHIMREKQFRRIPIIMMSIRDDVSIVVKCLRLGAADYLVKPLRTNELLNLWTHMWRRRRMLGLEEKNLFNLRLELLDSDPSDTGTNSTALFSDDTDDKKLKTVVYDDATTTCHESESNALHVKGTDDRSEVLPNNNPGRFSFPRKSELKIGESSAFFTYIRTNTGSGAAVNFKSTGIAAPPRVENSPTYSMKQIDAEKSLSSSIHTSPTVSSNILQHVVGEPSMVPSFRENEVHKPLDDLVLEIRPCPTGDHVAAGAPHEYAHHFSQSPSATVNSLQDESSHFMSQAANQIHAAPPAMHMFQGIMEVTNQSSVMLHPYNAIPHYYQHAPFVSPFSCLPLHANMNRVGAKEAAHPWQTVSNTRAPEIQPAPLLGRREVALMKFRSKRKDRCFDKKIRYVNRKRLAERRPRVRGQFIKQVNDSEVSSSGQLTADNNSEGDEDDEEEE